MTTTQYSLILLVVLMQSCFEFTLGRRYMLYDINPGEGFNLRRDVYIRMANLVKLLNEKMKTDEFALVLPPWKRMYHWRSKAPEDLRLQWKTFFDIPSMSLYIPVLEFEDYLKERGTPVVDRVMYLQRYEEGWKDGKWETKIDVRPCIDENRKYNLASSKVTGGFWGFNQVYAKRFDCVSAQADIEFFRDWFIDNVKDKAVKVDRAETLIHGMLSEWSSQYWSARRSMRFSKELRMLGDDFRNKFLNSSDENDKTVLPDNWHSRKNRNARGGPYLAVHLRRRDYLYAHRDNVPTLHYAAETISNQLKKLNINKVFVATDAPWYEFDELKKHLPDYEVYQYEAGDDVLQRVADGGVAIIDQWICSHARHFIGTAYSTFSFRIHEEREILGFEVDSTFNALCDEDVEKKQKCEQPTKWLIQY